MVPLPIDKGDLVHSPDFLPTECDVIMEGGVTSGVVFPTFIAGLARHFTLRSIGGTSVGAVAAVAAAAAQFRRNAGGGEGGFKQLAHLPLWLQDRSALGPSNLFSLFQPCPELSPHFDLLQVAIQPAGKLALTRNLILSLFVNFPKGAALGILLTVAVFAAGLFFSSAPLVPGTFLSAVTVYGWLTVKVLFFGLMFALLEFVLSMLGGLRRNRCGICSGMSGPASRHRKGTPALTQWLDTLVQEIAGLPPDAPLTFDCLEASVPSIELAFITTGISEMRSHRLPIEGRDLLFRISELRKLFPASIVDSMVKNSRLLDESSESTKALLKENDPGLLTDARDLYFLPPAGQWPIVFAARLSLSFPILLQAVPLYRLRGVKADELAKAGFALKKIWFSDGGLTSNFPIHFFDSLLPTRPTFGIVLEPTLAASAPPTERVSLPTNNMQGLTGSYLDIHGLDGLPGILGFAAALLRTIRSWRDEALKRTPGFRDRIVEIRHTKSEGGLNLNMPLAAIQAMSESGTAAADLVIKRFLTSEPKENGWLNHRLVRMKSAAALLQDQMRPLVETWNSCEVQPSYKSLWDETTLDVPTCYPINHAQRSKGGEFWQALVAASAASFTADLSDGAPQPRPSLQIAPKQN